MCRLKLFFFCLLLFAINAALPSVCSAARNWYIRDGASGDGSDWANAWDDLPASLTRGDTYYIADGNYGGHVFNDAVDGSTYIYIKKAIESDHGTDTGWNINYGDDVATFVMDEQTWYGAEQEAFWFEKSYYVLDGQTGGGPRSWDSGHGFKFICTDALTVSDYRGLIRFGKSWVLSTFPDYIELTHLEMTSPDRSKYDGDVAVYHTVNPELVEEYIGPQNITISYCYIHDIGKHLKMVEAGNWLIEYNYFARDSVDAPGGNQGESFEDFGGDNMVVRYNLFEDNEGTGNIALKSGVSGQFSAPSDNWTIYGNVFFWNPDFVPEQGVGTGIIVDTGNEGTGPSATTNIKVYNNVFANITGWGAGLNFTASTHTGNVAYNNIWYNCNARASQDFFEGVDTHDYNWFYGNIRQGTNCDSALSNSEPNAEIGTADPFVDWENGDFNLADGTLTGIALSPPYDTDMLDKTRAYDGVWDRGAYEYIGGPDNTPPTILSVTVHSPVEILFSEALDEASATDISNYSISPGIIIYSATLEDDLRTVILETSDHAENVQYTLTVEGVKDVAGNPMPQTTRQYEYTPLDINAGLVGYWKFDEGSGTSAADSSGNGNTATLINLADWTDKGEVTFDGFDDAVEIPTANWSTNTGTIALWARAEDFSGTRYFFGHNVGFWTNTIQLYATDGNLNVGLGGSHLLRTNIETLQSQVWYHLALTWDGTNYAVYINGIEKASDTYPAITELNTFADIGNTGNTSYRDQEAFDGIIDEVRIYNRALTVEELSDIALVFLPIGDKSVDEGSTLTFKVRTRDPNATIRIDEHNLPSDPYFFYDGGAWTFSWTPTYDDAGSYDVNFVSSDDFEIISITVNDSNLNGPPVANAGPDQTVTDTDGDGNQQVSLDGSASTDPDGTIVSYVWTEGGNQIATGVNPAVTLAIGVHTITLTVTDDGGSTGTDTVIITVSPVNSAPVADAGPDQNVTDTDGDGSQQVSLDGSASTDPDGTIVSYVWTEGGNQIATGVNPAVTLAIGVHTITLTVTDDGGLEDADEVIITVKPKKANGPPVLEAIPDKSVSENSLLSFSISATDPDGDPITYSAQNLPAGAVFSIDTFTWTPTSGQAGSYDVTFIASDGQLTDSQTITITVTPAGSGSVADGETSSGTVSGSYTDTHGSDNIYESIQEAIRGKNQDRSGLVHKWTIDVTGGDTVTFYVEAHHTANTEGDDFTFAYSTDDSAYTDMLTVTKTFDDNTYQSYQLPSNISGTVYIRVLDTDRVIGNITPDTIYIDHMYIRSEGGGTIWTLTVDSSSGGSVTAPGEGDFDYNPSEVVPIEASADISYYFVEWTGDIFQIANPFAASTTITMDADYTIQANFAILPADVDDVADGETSSGTVSGSYTDTHGSDDTYESIQETIRGKNQDRSGLVHKWTIDVTGGDTVTFYVEAHNTANTEGDDFTFAYSTDGSIYTDMLTVAKTVDDNTYQSYQLPSNISGTVYIRVLDTDRVIGNTALDTIYIDHMYIRSGSGS